MPEVRDQAGFELAVRLAKFAFEISTEFCALVAKSACRENFAPEVLYESIRLVSAVRFQWSCRCGSVCSNQAAMHVGSLLRWPCGSSQCLREYGRSMEPVPNLN